MKRITWLFLSFLLYFSVECLGQTQTKITDTTICSVLDKFIAHLEEKGELENAIIRIKLRAHSVEPGIDPDSLKGDSNDLELKEWNAMKMEYYFFLANERRNSTLDLQIPSYYSLYKKIPVLISSGIEGMVTPDPAAVTKIKRILTKHFMPPGLLPVSSVWYVTVSNGKYKVQEIF